MAAIDEKVTGTAVSGNPTEEDIILVGPGCRMSCTFCPHSGGRAGHPVEKILEPGFELPVANRVTILAGDVIRAELAPVVGRLRAAGAADVFVYAHPGSWDLEAIDALKVAGLTGLHLMLPAARRDAMSRLSGGKGSLALTARLIDHANRLGLRVAAEIPVVESSAALVDDTVTRFLKLTALPDRVVLRFLSEFHPSLGPRPWNQGIAAESVAVAASACRAAGVPMILAHPEAPPPCMMDIAGATAEMYPGLNMTGGPVRERPYALCADCAVKTICTAVPGFPGAPPAPVPDLSAAAADGPSSLTIWSRQTVLSELRNTIRDRKIPCRYPWEQLEAHDIRGVVTPCAGGWPLESTVNQCRSWHDSSLLAAWNSEAMQAVRAAVASGDPMTTCKPDCPAFHGGPQSALPSMTAPTTRVIYDNMVANIREMLEGATVLKSRPQSISFSPTLRCTNRCRMCDIHEVMEIMGRPAIVREMPDALFNELSDLLPTTRMLALTGGEPLVSRRMRQILMKFAADRYPDGAVTLTTNGQLLNEKLLRDLSATRIRLFYVSLNAADDAMYEYISGIRGGFTRVRNHLRMLIDMAPRMAGRPGVVVSFVVMRSNFHQLPAFLDFASGLGTGIRLLPIERDRLGESFFTDEETLRAVRDMLATEVMPGIARLPWGYRTEILKLRSVVESRLARREFGPL